MEYNSVDMVADKNKPKIAEAEYFRSFTSAAEFMASFLVHLLPRVGLGIPPNSAMYAQAK